MAGEQRGPATSEPKGPAEELVDMVFFAPLGLALECLDRFPELVARGRKQTQFAQSLGKMALGGFGRTPAAARSESPPSKPAASKPAESKSAPEGSKPPVKEAPVKAAPKTKTASKPKAAAPSKAGAKPKADAGRDISEMNARDAIVWVATLNPAQVAAAESAERSGKGRVTVLRAIERALTAS